MATLAMASIVYTNNTDAEFRIWAKYIQDTFLLTGAWVQTSDTGQINMATVVKPAAANTKSGYGVYKMNDTLQASAPCFVRIDYGSGSNQLYPGVWITIGTGSDGSGGITTKKFDGGSTTSPTIFTQNNATARNSYGSASTNRITVLMGVGTSQITFGFGIERTKNSSGADTATGFLLALQANQNMQRPASLSGTSSLANSNSCCLFYGLWSGTQPPLESGWSYILHTATSTGFASDIGLGVPIPLATTAKQPGTNFLVCRSGDYLLEASVTVTMYGSSVTFLRSDVAPVMVLGGTSVSQDANARLMFRYD